MDKVIGNKRTRSIPSNHSRPTLSMELDTLGVRTTSRLYKEYLLKSGLVGNKGID